MKILLLLISLIFLNSAVKADLNINYAPASNSQFVEISPDSNGEIAGSMSDEAKAYRSLLQKQYSQAAQQFYRLIQQRGQQAPLLYGLALSYQKSGNNPAAVNVWQHLLALPNLDPAMKAYAQLNLATLQPSNPDTLQKIAEYAVNKAEAGAIYATMGHVLLQQGNFQQGLQSLELAYKNAPQNILYAYNLAVVYDQQGNVNQALPLYKRVAESQGIATKLEPDTINALRKRIAALEN